jgi:hypothetical protein
MPTRANEDISGWRIYTRGGAGNPQTIGRCRLPDPIEELQAHRA